MSLDRSLSSLEQQLLTHYDRVIHDFLIMDLEVNSGRAQWLWPLVLAQTYPALKALALNKMILSLLVRGLRKQESGCGGQTLDFVEVFAGMGWLTHELLRGGFAGVAFDYVMSASHDILTSAGLRLVLNAVCQVRKFGLCWLGTPCSSFTVLCRCQSRRLPENGFLGEADGYDFVKTGNYLMEITSLIFFLCYLLSVWVAIEQPKSSCMMECASLKGVAYYCQARRIMTYMGAFSGLSQKPLQILTTWEKLQGLERPRPSMVEAESLVERSENGFTGRKDLLQQSQVYTQTFGHSVCEICQAEWQ